MNDSSSVIHQNWIASFGEDRKLNNLLQKCIAMVTLKEAYKGYRRGELTGARNGYRYEVRLCGSGAVIYCYEDEFERD